MGGGGGRVPEMSRVIGFGRDSKDAEWGVGVSAMGDRTDCSFSGVRGWERVC